MHKRIDEDGKEILVIEQSDLDNSMSWDEIGTLVTKENLIKEEREYFIKRYNKLVLSGITENGFLELANTIRNQTTIQPPIILYGYKGEKQ